MTPLNGHVAAAPSVEATATSLAAVLARFDWDQHLALDPQQRDVMHASVGTVTRVVQSGRRVYGLTTGFGPNASYEGSSSSSEQGLGLISHLCAGQGAPLSPDTTRLMIGLRLAGMARGYSGVSPGCWDDLAAAWNLGFTPVVPSLGSVSASGDLIPLAHAALALAGRGEAWQRQETGWCRVPAASALADIGLVARGWQAREALAFVNGTTASLAQALRNHWRIMTLCRAAACMTGVLVELLASSTEPYLVEVAMARNSRGQQTAANWIRSEVGVERRGGTGRCLQEPYSLRCAPQVIGAVLDQLAAQGELLLAEAAGCSDNPIVTVDDVIHAGNFHAASTGLCSDAHMTLVHQIAFLAERQLALALDPSSNGGRPPLLTPRPGPGSGLAGVQLAATSMVARIRQLASPATLTALPTNLNNQDIVPNALNGAIVVDQLVDLADLVLGSLALAVVQLSHLDGVRHPEDTLWSELQELSPPLAHDRPMHEEVRAASLALYRHSDAQLRTRRKEGIHD
ncbi:MAG: aromatic amino acid ammonia-lyase [Actinomycetota bacterium]|nr:aromatic amino acid ammonia-lyase [Actinomycetota bacterium]